MTDHPDIDLHRLMEAMAPLVPEAADWWIPTHDVQWPRLNTEIGGRQARLNLLQVRQTVFCRECEGYIRIGESPGETCMRVSSPGLAPESHARIQTAFVRTMHRWGLMNPWYGMPLVGLPMLEDMRRWRRAARVERISILDRLKPRFFGTPTVPIERAMHLSKLLDDYAKWSRDRMRWDRVTRYRGRHQPVRPEPDACGCPLR